MIALICDKCKTIEEHDTGSDVTDFKIVNIYNIIYDFDYETNEDKIMPITLCSSCFHKYKKLQVQATSDFINKYHEKKKEE